MRQGKVEQAIATGNRAVEHQPDLVIAHYFLGGAYMVAMEQHDLKAYPSAVRHLVNATMTDGRWAGAWLCLGQIALLCGEYEHAERFLLKGDEIERRGPGFGYFTGFSLLLGTVADRRGDSEKARELYAASTSLLESGDHIYREAFLSLTACGLGDILLREGHAEAALAEFRRASRLVKEYPRMLGRQRVLARTLTGMSAVHAAQGNTSRARQLIDEALPLLEETSRSPQTSIWGAFLPQLCYSTATAYLRAGEQDQALDWLGKAVNTGWRDLHWLSSDPDLAVLRPLPLFEKLCDNLKALPAVDFNLSSTSGARTATLASPRHQ
jgi:tetratricopeptide (TPR) repeat protein